MPGWEGHFKWRLNMWYRVLRFRNKGQVTATQTACIKMDLYEVINRFYIFVPCGTFETSVSAAGIQTRSWVFLFRTENYTSHVAFLQNEERLYFFFFFKSMVVSCPTTLVQTETYMQTLPGWWVIQIWWSPWLPPVPPWFTFMVLSEILGDAGEQKFFFSI